MISLSILLYSGHSLDFWGMKTVLAPGIMGITGITGITGYCMSGSSICPWSWSKWYFDVELDTFVVVVVVEFKVVSGGLSNSVSSFH